MKIKLSILNYMRHCSFNLHPVTLIISLFVVVLYSNCLYASMQNAPRTDISDKAIDSCGPLAIRTVLLLLGHSVDLSLCAELAETDPNGFTTLTGLQNAANALGYPTKALKLTPQELALIGGPAILHITLPNIKDHYVVFNKINNGWFELIDPVQSNQKAFCSADQLLLMWKGNCIIFSKNPFLCSVKAGVYRARYMITLIIGLASGIFIAILINNIISRYVRFSFDIKMALTRRSAAIFLGSILLIVTIILPFIYKTINNRKLNGPRLILGTTVLDVGDINLGDTYVSSIWIANNGINLLKIDDKKIKTSCSCFRYKISELELKQSDKSELKFKITPAKKLGPFQYSIYIPSNDPQGGKVLTVKGQVKGAGGVIYPPRLYFGRITNAEGKRKELFYILRRPDVEVLNVTSDLPFVTCTFSKRISGAHEIDVSLTKIPKPGPFEGSIKIVTNDPETEYAEISVPISGIVTPVSEDKLLSVK